MAELTAETPINLNPFCTIRSQFVITNIRGAGEYASKSRVGRVALTEFRGRHDEAEGVGGAMYD